MAEEIKAISWEAPEHYHEEKGSDWYWILGIVALAAAAAMIAFNNTLFAVVILLGAITIAIVSLHEPKIIPYSVMTRGIRVGNDLYTYSNLESYRVDEENPQGPQLLIKSNGILTPLIIMPIPPEHVDTIDALLSLHLKEEHLEEPFAHKLMEYIGF